MAQLDKLIKIEWVQIEKNQNDDKKKYLITQRGKKIVENEMDRLKGTA